MLRAVWILLNVYSLYCLREYLAHDVYWESTRNGRFGLVRRQWRLLQEEEMTATGHHPTTCHVCNVQVFVQFVDSVTGFKVITLIRPVPLSPGLAPA